MKPKATTVLVCAHALALACIGIARPASAFCRATTCDDGVGYCLRDGRGCQIEGLPVGFELATFVELELEDPKGDLSDEEEQILLGALRRASRAWLVEPWECERGEPNIGLHPEFWGEADTETPEETIDDPGFGGAGGWGGAKPAVPDEFDSRLPADVPDEAPRGSVAIRYHEVDWPYERKSLGKTILEFDTSSGIISSATIHVNGQLVPLSWEEDSNSVDLVGIVTHEFGHALGLDHSTAKGATMEAVAAPDKTALLRTLEWDDVDGLCSLYPPASQVIHFDVPKDLVDEPEDEKKFLWFKCSTWDGTPRSTHQGPGGGLLLVLVGFAALRRRRGGVSRPLGVSEL